MRAASTECKGQNLNGFNRRAGREENKSIQVDHCSSMVQEFGDKPQKRNWAVVGKGGA